MSIGLAAAYARATTIELLRHPGYVIPTLVFPAMFFLFFAAPHAGAVATAEMCGFAAFAVIGVGFFQFGVAAANDRISPWETYVRTLPVSAGTRFAARTASAGIFAAASAAVVVAAAVASTGAGLPPLGYAELALVLAAALVPFALLGIALGYWATPRSALPIANLLYLAMSYGGGLWIQRGRLPAAVRAVSVFLPTRRVADLTAGVARGSPWTATPWVVLAGFTVVFGAAPVLGYRRDEGMRFR
ncbi:MAG: ABC transporter permease [Gaiellaceae bacterium]